MMMSCRAQFPDQPPTMVSFQKCANAAADATVGRYAHYPDLYQLAQAGKIEIADKADRGQITIDQANEEMALLNERVSQIRMNRNTQRIASLNNFLATQRAFNPAQIQQFIPSIQPQYPPMPPTITTNCFGAGDETSCTSN